MEKHKLRSFRLRRKKIQPSIMRNEAGGSGTEGVIVFGALAIASLLAAFTIKKGMKLINKDTTNLEDIEYSCRKEEDEGEGLRSILQDSASTLHQNSCCTVTDHGTSKIGNTQIENCELITTQSLIISEEKTEHCRQKDSNSINGDREIVISEAEEENIPMTDEIHVVKNETNDSSVMKTIHIETEDDEAVDANAKQSVEQKSTLQSSLSLDSVSSIEEEKCSPEQSSFSSEEEEGEEECSLMQSSFSSEEEEGEEECSLMQSSFSSEEEEGEEECSLMQSSFSTEEEDEYSPTRSSFSTEEEKEGSSPTESSFSTEEETNMEEDESSEETGSSSAESNMEAIWPAEMMGVLSPEPKEMGISQRLEEKDTTTTMEACHNLAKTFNKRDTEELIVMNVPKEHSTTAKRQIWVWLGLVLLLLLLVNCLLQLNILVPAFL